MSAVPPLRFFQLHLLHWRLSKYDVPEVLEDGPAGLIAQWRVHQPLMVFLIIGQRSSKYLSSRDCELCATLRRNDLWNSAVVPEEMMPNVYHIVLDVLRLVSTWF